MVAPSEPLWGVEGGDCGVGGGGGGDDGRYQLPSTCKFLICILKAKQIILKFFLFNLSTISSQIKYEKPFSFLYQ